MVRDTNAGKARFDLCWPDGVPFSEQLLTRFAMLMARGAEKYGNRNWERACDEAAWRRYRESGLRHHYQHLSGERDEDHAAAVLFNLMGEEYVAYKKAQPDPRIIKFDDGSTGLFMDSGTAVELPKSDVTVSIDDLAEGDSVTYPEGVDSDEDWHDDECCELCVGGSDDE